MNEFIDIRKSRIIRAITLLRASSDFIKENNIEELTTHYDYAECDGSCLGQECYELAEDLKELLELAKIHQ